ncbi:hypothetical protein M1L60_27075 [Actinoplanes sp. TRM 88003]|uniref:Integral membrane protein n=1 Tax=Paractinoplanes aksuensis TaxID=2939490 RepID=A0ABT1DTX2_9ACTN|nr:hypothetical protein [Actinoplanes aksuensis]MCO8274268.1 hypothetical protein [Actinoplanes aksuensis]
MGHWVFAAAVGVAVVADIFEATAVQYGAAAAALAVLSSGLRGRHGSVLYVFGLLLTAAALVDLAAELTRYPTESGIGADGCLTAAHYDYWRGQLRYQQAAAVMRFCALIAAFHAARRLDRHRAPARAASALVVVVALIYGTFVLRTLEQTAFQVPPPPPDDGIPVYRGCLFTVLPEIPPSAGEVVTSASLTTLVLVAPALFAWAVRTSADGQGERRSRS